MKNKIIREKPLFEIFIENDYLVINNTENTNNNGRFKIENCTGVELIQNLSFFNKLIQVYFGLTFPAKSNELRINMENSFRDIILKDCNIKKVELLIYEINQLIVKRKNTDLQ